MAGRRGTATAAVSILGSRRFKGIPARSTLVRWVRMAACGRVRIALVLAGRRQARALNRRYRRRDYATNVLTFGYQLAPVAQADIVICVPVARAEAKSRGIAMRAHLAHLVIHGTLHAQGYDHVRAADARRMQQLEIDCLARLRIADPYA